MELIKQTDEIRVTTENEGKILIEELKNKGREEGYEVINYSIVLKEKKSKGEIIDEWYLVKVVKRW